LEAKISSVNQKLVSKINAANGAVAALASSAAASAAAALSIFATSYASA
jgi:hypothetical protein